MKCLILAAGYATRLYPLTIKTPKPLLEIAGTTILDHLIANLEATGRIERYIVVTNDRYYDNFIAWRGANKKIDILNDGSVSNETRLGAVADIRLAVEKFRIDTDTIVIAGDNLIDFSFDVFLNYAREKNTSCIMRYYEQDASVLKRCGVIEIDGDDLVLGMEEKPTDPRSNWIAAPFYYFTGNDIASVKKALNDGCDRDAPGSYVAWLAKRAPVHAMRMPGRRFDIGTLESYHKASLEYEKLP